MQNVPLIDPQYLWGTLLHIADYIVVTLEITLASVVMGSVLGLLSAVADIQQIPVAKHISRIFVAICRSLPNMILLYLVYYGLPLAFLGIEMRTGIHIPYEKVPAIVVAIVGLTLHTGAYLSEIFRAAVQSVPQGQWEAAISVGMTKVQAFRRVILPQAFVFALPLFTNQFLSTMKSTSIVFVITVVEVLGAAKLYVEENSAYFEAYIVVALVYWGLGILFELIFNTITQYVSRYRRGNEI